MTFSARTIQAVTGHSEIIRRDGTVTAPKATTDFGYAPQQSDPIISTTAHVARRSAELNAVSEKQDKMIDWKMDVLAKIDPDGAASMREWLGRNREGLTGGRGGTASLVIDKLIKRIDAINAGTVVVSQPSRTETVTYSSGGVQFTTEVASSALTPTAPVKPKYDTFEDITDGNYAIERAGKVHFYRVTRKQGKGKYEGRTFTNVQERASEMLFDVRGPWAMRAAILTEIRTAGVEASHLLYAATLDRCWHCNILLTNTDNPYKVFGLGPVCGPKVMG